MSRRRRLDLDSYLADVRAACFVCELVAGRRPHHVVWEDDFAIAFMNAHPSLRGHVLVAPKQHREHVTADFSPDEYLRLQALVHRVGEAVRRAFPTERLYVLSLGSQQGNRHVHWHVAPLPPGVPYEQQQLEALRAPDGVLDLTDEELAADATAVREALAVDRRLYLEAPPLDLDDEQERAFAEQWERLRAGAGYDVPWPKHEFLRWLVRARDVLLHGTNDGAIERFEPRDNGDFVGRPVTAVFATSDGVWPMYFAIADRRVVRSLINDCVVRGGTTDYFFSVGTRPPDAYPWSDGTVYVLPRGPFEQGHGGVEWLSREPVTPLARVPVAPADFPFLERVHRHDPRESVDELEARLLAEVSASEA